MLFCRFMGCMGATLPFLDGYPFFLILTETENPFFLFDWRSDWVTMPRLKEGDSHSVDIIDASMKNKWCREWLKALDMKTPLGSWCVKPDRAGAAQCTVCPCELKYGTNGQKRLL